MTAYTKLVARIVLIINRYFLWLLLACCAAAAVVPGPGLWMRDVSFGQVQLFAQDTQINLPMLLLALLLLNAGLSIQPLLLRNLPRMWLVLFLGLMANQVIPTAFVFATTPMIGLWL